MSRFDGPGWRILGSVGSWTAFTFFFLGLYQAAGLVIGLGGFCASGGPYVIETECPDAVILFAPGGIFGMFLSVGIALVFARGFGVSLISWAWSVLFIGLGIQFLLGAIAGIGIVSNLICGVLFVAMGAAPAYFFASSKALVPALLGSRNLAGQPFITEGEPRRSFGMLPTGEGEQVAPTPTDWVLSLGLWVIAVALGTFLSVAAFTALASGGAG